MSSNTIINILLEQLLDITSRTYKNWLETARENTQVPVSSFVILESESTSVTTSVKMPSFNMAGLLSAT